MEKLLLYLQVHQLSEQGFKVAKIARKLGISRNTVYKYLTMSFEKASDWANSLMDALRNHFTRRLGTQASLKRVYRNDYSQIHIRNSSS